MSWFRQLFMAMVSLQASAYVLLQRREDAPQGAQVQVNAPAPPIMPKTNNIPPMPDISKFMPSAPAVSTMPGPPDLHLPSAPSFKIPNLPDAPNMPNIPKPNITVPNMPNMSYSSNYSLSGYMSSFYSYLPGISTMTNYLMSALSYLPSDSMLFNAILKALGAITPDYATLKSLYDQVSAKPTQHEVPNYAAPPSYDPEGQGLLPRDRRE